MPLFVKTITFCLILLLDQLFRCVCTFMYTARLKADRPRTQAKGLGFRFISLKVLL